MRIWIVGSSRGRARNLGSGDLTGGHLKWEQHLEAASLPHDAADFDAAMMIFDYTVGEREPKAGAIAFRGVERAENVGQVLRRDAPTGIADQHAGVAITGTDA